MNQQALLNCEKTVKKLVEFLAISERINEEYSRAAVIQAFEYTFEVFWKTFQKIGQSEGVMIGSPKAAFAYAFQAGLIKHENIWLKLLNDRNMTTHTYHEMIAKEIYERIKSEYVFEFQAAYSALIAL